MGQPVVHWEITARDPARLESFYRDMFDWSSSGDAPAKPASTGPAWLNV
jgi:predicted enzyme related to lactoylglutathione lyase